MLIAILFLLLMPIAHAQQSGDPSVQVHVIGTGSQTAYITVVETARPVPVRGLSITNFRVENAAGQRLEIQSIAEDRRPLHLVAIIDTTASADAFEVFNQKLGVIQLVEQLQATDQLALMVMTPTEARLIVPLTRDHQQVLNALENVGNNDSGGGNVAWDALYDGLLLLDADPSNARQAVILMTDATDPAGEVGESDVIELAAARSAEIFILYFEDEADGVPDGSITLPAMLQRVTDATGGSALASSAELRGGDYKDDEALPIMMEAAYDRLDHEYRLSLNTTANPGAITVSAVLPGSASVTSQGAPTTAPPATPSTTRITFPYVTAGQTIRLPFTLTINTEAPQPITRLQAFYVDASGTEIALDEVPVDNPTLTLDNLPPGAFELQIIATDADGVQHRAAIALEILNPTSIYWIDPPPPQTMQAGETITLLAKIGTPETVEEVVFTVNDAVQARLDQLPSGEVRFAWQPATGGDYHLVIAARRSDGSISTQQATVRVTGAAGDDDVLLPALVIGIVGGMVLVGAGWLLMRRRRRITAAPVGTIIPADDNAASGDLAPPTRQTILTNAALESTSGDKWRLVQGENTIGRHGSNLIQLPDESASRYHARIEAVGSRCFFSDWQASHPSEINGTLLEPNTRHELHAGDKIRIGSTLLIFTRIEAGDGE